MYLKVFQTYSLIQSDIKMLSLNIKYLDADRYIINISGGE